MKCIDMHFHLALEPSFPEGPLPNHVRTQEKWTPNHIFKFYASTCLICPSCRSEQSTTQPKGTDWAAPSSADTSGGVITSLANFAATSPIFARSLCRSGLLLQRPPWTNWPLTRSCASLSRPCESATLSKPHAPHRLESHTTPCCFWKTPTGYPDVKHWRRSAIWSTGSCASASSLCSNERASTLKPSFKTTRECVYLNGRFTNCAATPAAGWPYQPRWNWR